MDALVQVKFSEIETSLQNFRHEMRATSVAMDADQRVMADARLKILAMFDRLQELGDDIAAAKAMLAVR